MLNLNHLQIYDGFYTDKECKDIKERLLNITETYYNKYINNNGNINNTIAKKFDKDERTR